jgi:hypothetical protein
MLLRVVDHVESFLTIRVKSLDALLEMLTLAIEVDIEGLLCSSKSTGAKTLIH